MSAGTMTGVRGARCNRGWRRRETPATKAPAPRNLVRDRTLGCVSPKGRTAVERRQASAPCRVRAAPYGAAGRPASVGVLLPLIAGSESERFAAGLAPSPIVVIRPSTAGFIRRRSRARRRFWQWRASCLGCEQKTRRENGMPLRSLPHRRVMLRRSTGWAVPVRRTPCHPRLASVPTTGSNQMFARRIRSWFANPC